MFAASRGISSRIVGAGRRNKEGPNNGHRKRKRRKMTMKQRLYLPFMWSTCLGTFLGFLVLCGGTAMCVVGYYAEYFATTETISTTVNGTDIVIIKDSSMQFHIKNLTFVGPIFMGIGAFIIVVACVVVFETRDKLLDIMEEQQRTAAKKKPDFYDLIVAQMKKKEEDILRGGQDNLAFDDIEEDLESEKIKYTCTPIRVKRGRSPTLTSTSGAIGKALRNIGSSIFTIDMTRNNTLTPVPCHHPFESQITGSPLGSVIIKPRPHTLAVYGRHTDKYPSVSCIHDMMKANETCVQPYQRRHSWLDSSNAERQDPRIIYQIAPLDISLYSTIDSRPVNNNSSASKHQSQATIDPNEEASKQTSPLQGKCDQKNSGEGAMGFSSDEECSDVLSTGDTNLSLGPKDRRIKRRNEPLFSSIDSSDGEASKVGRTVVVTVHQAPKSGSPSDISARSSFETPYEIMKQSPETSLGNAHGSRQWSISPQHKTTPKMNSHVSRHELDTLRMSRESSKSIIVHENKGRAEKSKRAGHGKIIDDGNSSDSSSNA